jgi:hypothetical protein
VDHVMYLKNYVTITLPKALNFVMLNNIIFNLKNSKMEKHQKDMKTDSKMATHSKDEKAKGMKNNKSDDKKTDDKKDEHEKKSSVTHSK